MTKKEWYNNLIFNDEHNGAACFNIGCGRSCPYNRPEIDNIPDCYKIAKASYDKEELIKEILK